MGDGESDIEKEERDQPSTSVGVWLGEASKVIEASVTTVQKQGQSVCV